VARPHRNDVSLAEIARLAVLTMMVQALFLDILGRKQLWLFIALAGGLTVANQTRRRATLAPQPDGGVPLAAPVPAPRRTRAGKPKPRVQAAGAAGAADAEPDPGATPRRSTRRTPRPPAEISSAVEVSAEGAMEPGPGPAPAAPNPGPPAAARAEGPAAPTSPKPRTRRRG